MRKSLSILTLSFCLLSSLSSCAKKEDTTTVDTSTSIPADASVNAIETVASDKEKLRQTIILAHSKGTLEAALTEAAQDSIVRDALRAALAAAGGNARTAAAQSNTSTSARKSNTSTAAKTPAQKKDALDQANDAIDKTNRTIDRTTETVDKASEAARKADELLNRTRR
jgi:hypothetical protein